MKKGFRLSNRVSGKRDTILCYHRALRRSVHFNANQSLGLRHENANLFVGSYLTLAAFDFWLTTAMDSRHEVQFNRLNIIPA